MVKPLAVSLWPAAGQKRPRSRAGPTPSGRVPASRAGRNDGARSGFTPSIVTAVLEVCQIFRKCFEGGDLGLYSGIAISIRDRLDSRVRRPQITLTLPPSRTIGPVRSLPNNRTCPVFRSPVPFSAPGPVPLSAPAFRSRIIFRGAPGSFRPAQLVRQNRSTPNAPRVPFAQSA